jgi:hypothetical protein
VRLGLSILCAVLAAAREDDSPFLAQQQVPLSLLTVSARSASRLRKKSVVSSL